jgi:coenzyme Q-binding protein COQ10
VPQHQETRIVPYTAEQMYAVVADVERYPEFLPWCSRLTVQSRAKDGETDVVTAEMTVAYHGLSERYTSLVRADPKERSIEAVHIEGPFKLLDSRWRFVPLAQGCEIHFFIDFAFKSMVLSALAGVAFGMVASRMAEAFITRAHALYGSQKAKEQV